MALETTNKRSIKISGFSLKPKLIRFWDQLRNPSKNEIRVNKAKVGYKLFEFREEELSKFDRGFTTKVSLYTRKFF